MNPYKSLKSLPHDMWILFFATLINRSGTMVLPFLALYLTQDLRVAATSAGLLIAFYGGGALLTAPFAGRLSDKLGALKVMIFSLIISGILLIVYSFITEYIFLIALTLIWAVVSEAFRPANLAYISEVVSADQRRVAYALNRLAINIGMSIGPVAAGFLSLIDYSIIFYVDGITSIIAGIFLIYAPWEKSNNTISSTETSEEDIKTLNHSDSNKKLIYFLIAMIPISMVFFQHISTMPLFVVDELGISAATYGLLFAINTGLVILFEVPLNDYLGKFKEGRVLAVGAFLTGLGFGGMAFCTDVFSVAITIVIWTVGEMIILPISVSYVSNIAPDNKRGAYMGFYQMIFNLAFTMGPWLGTIIMETHGSRILWYAIFILGLISTLMMLKLDKK